MIRFFVASAVLTAGASAQSFTYSIDPAQSDISVVSSVTLDLTGNLKGAFEAATNPGGTRTLSGLFGDPGTNAEIPLSLGLGISLDLGGAGAGSFTLIYDPNSGEVSVDELVATVGAGTTSQADLSVTLEYDTFRTVAPGSLFIGGIPLTLPIGAATASDIELVQSAAAVGTAVPSGTPGVIDVDLIVPVDLSLVVDLGTLGGGTPTPVGPIPFALPISGSFDLAACDTRLEALTNQTISQSIPSPFPLAFDDLPLDLPTILPPGSTANLLLTAALDTLNLDGTITSDLVATAADGRVQNVCFALANSTGLGAVLDASGSQSVANEDLGFTVTSLPQGSFGFLLMSQTEAKQPGFGGSQGTLCIGEPCFRFSNNVQNSGLLGEVAFAPDFGNLPMGQQFIAAESWVFQYWFRDANPQPTSNTSSALRVTFCR
jgi:hypothetical protein